MVALLKSGHHQTGIQQAGAHQQQVLEQLWPDCGCGPVQGSSAGELLENLLRGGISFATPPGPVTAGPGTRFELHREEDDRHEWAPILKWQGEVAIS